MARIVHFEIASENPERSADFYREVFNWEIVKWDGPIDYWLVMTGKDEPGIDGGIMKKTIDLTSTINTVDVPNLDEYIGKVISAGGEIHIPKMPVPGVGWMAYCKDTEGNVFGIMQNDPSVGT